MSVDIGWETITSGGDGIALAEQIRDFIHEKFQQVALPRFIKSVHVHSFEFGTACPEIEIKDICDPLPDFYEDEDEDAEDSEEFLEDVPPTESANDGRASHRLGHHEKESDHPGISSQAHLRPLMTGTLPQFDVSALRSTTAAKEPFGLSDHLSGPFHRSTTPGIPGGTSNLSYFHFPVSGLSGTQTPLAAVASGTPFSSRPWPNELMLSNARPEHAAMGAGTRNGVGPQHGYDELSTRPSTANSISSPRESESSISSPKMTHATTYTAGTSGAEESALDAESPPSSLRIQSRQPSDMQVVAHVKYSGDVRMTLTAEILLDYPMPSFVGIPLKLVITGMTFDGVAIVAWINKKMHFCFLDPEDAATIVGEELTNDLRKDRGGRDSAKTISATLLKEIHVESEIGRQTDGKQVLKNVGKVEKFVLEQVRRIFEDEFVFPSYWTFLV